ncbi:MULTISPECIES: N-acetyltransferase [Brevibacterium]|uniref:GNAT family N-acetyltransferase n=2 Tax=Brevibacterium TaxID=1696 RepID=A0ABP9U3P5_9MICO
MNDHSGAGTNRAVDMIQPVELVWGLPGGLGDRWEPVESAAGVYGVLPPPSEVGDLYGAAAAEPPLNEDRKYALLFADVYEASVRKGQVLAALARSTADGRLRALAYGHFWAWAEQDYDWAYELKDRLGDTAPVIEWTFALNLLARDPNLRTAGLGRRTLETWLSGISGYGCWLQTDDIDSPARRLYESLGFTAIGHGPQAPNGEPGLVMYRPPQQT